MDAASLHTPRSNGGGRGGVAFAGPALMPYCPPIQEECPPPTPKTSSTPNILALTEVSRFYCLMVNFCVRVFLNLTNTFRQVYLLYL
jgi:hypothetical protein